MKNLKFIIYYILLYIRSVHELKDPDKERRLMCTIGGFRSLVDNNEIEELDRVFFGDEMWFHLYRIC